jgi:hypothetical protein
MGEVTGMGDRDGWLGMGGSGMGDRDDDPRPRLLSNLILFNFFQI